MSAHARAFRSSRELCDRLFALLAAQIPVLEREQTKQWCALYQPGRSRFAYVQHRLTDGRLEVWCRGDPQTLKSQPGVDFRARGQIRGGWEESFPGRFEIEDDRTMAGAVSCLLNVSYRGS